MNKWINKQRKKGIVKLMKIWKEKLQNACLEILENKISKRSKNLKKRKMRKEKNDEKKER